MWRRSRGSLLTLANTATSSFLPSVGRLLSRPWTVPLRLSQSPAFLAPGAIQGNTRYPRATALRRGSLVTSHACAGTPASSTSTPWYLSCNRFWGHRTRQNHNQHTPTPFCLCFSIFSFGPDPPHSTRARHTQGSHHTHRHIDARTGDHLQASLLSVRKSTRSLLFGWLRSCWPQTRKVSRIVGVGQRRPLHAYTDVLWEDKGGKQPYGKQNTCLQVNLSRNA